MTCFGMQNKPSSHTSRKHANYSKLPQAVPHKSSALQQDAPLGLQPTQPALASPNRTALQTPQAAAQQKHSRTQAAASHTHQGPTTQSAARAFKPKRYPVDLLFWLRLTAKAKAKARA
jgi:hypothetical protein